MSYTRGNADDHTFASEQMSDQNEHVSTEFQQQTHNVIFTKYRPQQIHWYSNFSNEKMICQWIFLQTVFLYLKPLRSVKFLFKKVSHKSIPGFITSQKHSIFRLERKKKCKTSKTLSIYHPRERFFLHTVLFIYFFLFLRAAEIVTKLGWNTIPQNRWLWFDLALQSEGHRLWQRSSSPS